jgi:biotin operon repressor
VIVNTVLVLNEMMKDTRPYSSAEIQEATELTRGQVNQAMANLAQKGKIVKISRGLYRYDPDGSIRAQMEAGVPSATEWTRIEVDNDTVAGLLPDAIKGTPIGTAKSGNTVMVDTEGRLWEVRIVVEGKLV